MKNSNLPIFPIVVLIGMVIGAYLAYTNLEFEELEYFAGKTDAAKKNSHLAAARLLEKQGFSYNIVENRSTFSTLDITETGVLWIQDLNQLISEQEVDSILSWVTSGGVLLTSPVYDAAFSATAVSAEFLENIGISAFEEDELNEYLDRPSLIHNNNLDAFEYYLPDYPKDSKPFFLHSSIVPYFRSDLLSGDNTETILDTPYLIHKRIGDGYVTVYSDYAMFDNRKIAQLDHAYLLLWLTHPAKVNTVSLVFSPSGKPGLLKQIWNRFPITVAILGIVLLGFLRWASSRLGPIEQELPPIKNNIMAHLEARGEYWYRHNHLNKITENIQDAALDKLQRKKISRNDTDRSTTIKQTIELLKCNPTDAEKALYGHFENDNEILTTSRTLQRINHRKPTIRNN